MKYARLTFAMMLCLATVAQAQDAKSKLSVFGGEQAERSSVRLGYWDPEKKAVVGEFVINYGRPAWKKEYENAAAFDLMTKGKVWRLGSNYFTVLDTNLPLKIAGKDVPVGMYYLGLHRSEDGGTWSLAFIDPVKARTARLDAFAITQAPVEFRIPMTLEKATETKDKLTIALTSQKENMKSASLRISWGQLQLSAPIEVSL